SLYLKFVYTLSDLAHPCKCHFQPSVGLVKLLHCFGLFLVKVGKPDNVLDYLPALFGVELGYPRDHTLLYNVQLVRGCKYNFKELHYGSLADFLAIEGILALSILPFHFSSKSDRIFVYGDTSVEVVKR